MRITFKHILFLISLLAFLGAISVYAGTQEDLEKQLTELEALNKSSTVIRAPAKLDPPTPLPKEEDKLVEVTGEEKVQKPQKTELTKHADSILAFMQEELMPSLESKEIKRMVATTETEKKPFNYAADEYKNHRRSDKELKTAKQEETLWQIKNGYRVNDIREVVQSDGTPKIIWPEEPLFASVARARQARQFKETQDQQAQNIENLQRELNTYKTALTNPILSQNQLDDIIQRYQDLLIKPNPTPATKEKIPSGEEIWTPILPPLEQAKQDTILESLQETLEELQTQGQQDRVRRILDDVVVKKLDQTADVSNPDSYPDPKSYKDTIKILRKVHDYKDPNDPTKDVSVPQIYEKEFVKRDTDLKDKVQEVEQLLDESILNALNEDFSGNLSSAVAQLNSVADMLQTRVLALADIRQVSPRELIGRALDKEKTPEERFAAIQRLVALMEDSTKGIDIRKKEKNAILDFLNNEYPAYLAQKKEECEKTGQTTLAMDEGKLNQLLTNIGSVQDYLVNFSTLSASQRSLASQRLENVKQLLAKIEAKFDAALASSKLTKEQEELCKQGKITSEACRTVATQTQKSLDAAIAAPEDFTNLSSNNKDQR